ncbi:hypothetical protein [Hyalangium sp.]|uniref:hypothetical protein n=1 Tax=Hyalangium sp. TaxID=2028555 RepID=UPI002D57CB17|nr:hypothetical protein [Hyalangium sp.]HYI03010.1 hypothetical protein [Hyalangium sp.]
MRSIKWVAAVVAVSSLLGCGGSQPAIYRVAVARLVAESVPSSCYRAGQAPTTIPDKSTNLVDQQQWVIWEGLDGTVYLEPGTINYGMGQAERVVITGDAIQGSKVEDQHVFTSERTQTDSTSEVYATSASYTIDTLGDTLEGSLALHSQCTGADCGGIPTCDITLTFVGRKIDADQFSLYTTNAGD